MGGLRLRVTYLLDFPGERGHYFIDDGLGPLQHSGRGQAAQGMGDSYGMEPLPSEGAGVDVGRIHKGLGADYHRGYAQVFQGHGVVHTARSARPSIGYGGDHEVAPGGQRFDDIRRGGTGVNVLVQGNSAAQLVSLFHEFFHVF